jgi:HD-GYP domain-containing protein (c-di-GMP phosphodiesterase class II)
LVVPVVEMLRQVDRIAGFLPVSISTLLPDNVIGVRLYIHDTSAGGPRLYRGADIAFERKDRDRLLDRGMRALYINVGDHARYQVYLRNHLPVILGDESIPVHDRFATLNTVVRDVLAGSFRANDVDASLEGADKLAEHCVELMSRDDFVASEIIGLLNHDYQTFTHSANVAYYCLLLAQGLGIQDGGELKAIAVGGFIHDLGKLDIPDRILNKPGKLTDQEFDIIKEHPRTGFLKLCHREDVSFSQLMMVYQHHERVDGGGYPVGLTKDELHDWARLCTVADVYEALTSNRPYRSKLSSVEVLQIMQRDSGKKFDEEILQCWTNTIARKS